MKPGKSGCRPRTDTHEVEQTLVERAMDEFNSSDLHQRTRGETAHLPVSAMEEQSMDSGRILSGTHTLTMQMTWRFRI
jgi:hypothetical protein